MGFRHQPPPTPSFVRRGLTVAGRLPPPYEGGGWGRFCFQERTRTRQPPQECVSRLRRKKLTAKKTRARIPRPWMICPAIFSIQPSSQSNNRIPAIVQSVSLGIGLPQARRRPLPKIRSERELWYVVNVDVFVGNVTPSRSAVGR